MTTGRIGVRTRLLIAVFVAVAVAIALSVAAFDVLLGQRLDASARSLARDRAEAELSSLDVRAGRVIVREEPSESSLSGQSWVFAGLRPIDVPRASNELQRAARTLAAGPEQTLDIRDETRLYALPVTRDGIRLGTVVSAVSLAPYEETGRTALVGAMALAVLVLASVTLLAWWMLGHAMRPVAKMSVDAAAWSEHDLDRRFDLGEPYDELTRLGATLDNLLERIASSLRHEQRFTAEISHELRTPLTRISGEAELMLKRVRTGDEYRAALEAIQRNADQMTRTVSALVGAARHEAGLVGWTSDVRAAAAAAVSTAREANGECDVSLRVPSDPLEVAVESELVERMLEPLLANAVHYGRGDVIVRVTRTRAEATVDVEDDGQGVAEDEVETIFNPGMRGQAALARVDGAGLGLALARRLARSAGGDVVVTPDASGGRFSLRLPLAD